MIKEILKEKEPIAYAIIKNILEKDRSAHSFLFSGELNNLKIDTAYLLAQSIIENKKTFACEECETCKRIKSNEYYDVIFIDGYKGLIKNEMIENILSEFHKTALEKAQKKIYIIANVNNTTHKALNSLLKFMEEPSNDNTYAIIISDHKEDLLPTIISRCIEIPFMTRDFNDIKKEYLNHDFIEIDAYLLADIYHSYDKEKEEEKELFLLAKEYIYKTIDHLDNKEYLPILYSQEMFNEINKKEDFKIFTDYYFDIMIKILEDSLNNELIIKDEEYLLKITEIKKYDNLKLLEIFEEARLRLNMNVDRKLLFDRISYAIISYI